MKLTHTPILTIVYSLSGLFLLWQKLTWQKIYLKRIFVIGYGNFCPLISCNVHLLAQMAKNSHKAMSFYPDFVLILSWFYPDFVQILSRFYLDKIWNKCVSKKLG